MFSKLLLPLAATIVLAGCTSTEIPPVVRIPGTFTALTIPLISDRWEAGKVQLAVKNKNGCGEFSGDILPDTSVNDYTLDIEGNRDLFFHIARADSQIECNSYGVFYATSGNTYILNLEIKNRQCEVSLIEKAPYSAPYKINTYTAYASNVDGKKVCLNKDKLY